MYRIYRPKKFTEVSGQDHVTKTLENMIKTGNISHAYLFCGTRGTGKTSVARIFAKQLINNDFNIFEIDAASNNRVEDVRDLIEKVKYPPINSKYKIYIIDEVHMFSQSAFNAFLKTLEEPPSHVIFILCTTEPHKLLPTVQSRCIRFDFRNVASAEIEKIFVKIFKAENITAEPEAIKLIAEVGAGSVRDALSFADMVRAYSGGQITKQKVQEVLGSVDEEVFKNLLTAICDKNVKSITNNVEKIFSVGRNASAVVKDFLNIIKNEFINNQQKKLMEIYGIFAEVELNIKTALDAKNMFEGACLQCLTHL